MVYLCFYRDGKRVFTTYLPLQKAVIRRFAPQTFAFVGAQVKKIAKYGTIITYNEQGNIQINSPFTRISVHKTAPIKKAQVAQTSGPIFAIKVLKQKGCHLFIEWIGYNRRQWIHKRDLC